MDDSGTPLLSVTQTRDGVWSVNEREPTRVAIAYFPSRWGALRHALRVARARRRCRVSLVDRTRGTLLSHDYSQEKT
ncbi:MAG TPA: hypothetical protein VFR66_13580 [Burkholderiales bacterium]|nr:hypothetical protein [Burkholderiales bacterium]